MAAKKTPYGAIPRVQGQSADVKALITIAETLIGTRGDGLEKAVTHRELRDGGYSLSGGGSGGSGGGGGGGSTPPMEEVETPTAPTGFEAIGLYSAVVLSWNRATYAGHAYTEIWRSQEDAFSTAALVGTELGVLYPDSAVELGQPYFWWARHVNKNGDPGPINATAGTTARTVIPAAAIIEAVSGEIRESDLHIALQTKLDDSYNGVQELTTVTMGPNGLTAQYVMKMESNGLLAGFGLFNNGTISDFGISVDRFWIGSPTYIARAANTAYLVGDIRTNSGNVYKVIAVTSDKKSGAGAGPTGTGADIADGNVRWKYLRVNVAATPFSLIVQDGQVLIPSAKIIDLQVDGAVAGRIGADKIIGIDASFIMARMNTGSITNAYIGQTIQSYNYNPSIGQGWLLDKANGLIIGNILVLGPNGETLLESGQRRMFVGRSKNILSNTTFLRNLDAWVISNWGTNNGQLATGLGLAGADWVLTGEGTVTIRQNGTQAADIYGDLYYNKRFPVYPGMRLEASAYTGAHRCHASVLLAFYDSAGNWVAETITGVNTAAMPGGRTLAGYQRTGGIVTVPANATQCLFVFRKYGTIAGSADSYAFMSRPFLGEAGAGQTELSVWADGAPDGAFSTLSQINGWNISTYIANLAVNTLQLADQAVTIPVAASNSNDQQLPFPFSAAYLGCIGLAIGSTGAPINITVSTKVLNSRNDESWFKYRLRRAPLFGAYTTIDENRGGDANAYPIRANSVFPHSFTFRDQPGAGLWAYVVEYCAIEEFIRVQDINILVQETKK